MRGALVGLTEAQVEAARTWADLKLAEAIEIFGAQLRKARQASGALKRRPRPNGPEPAKAIGVEEGDERRRPSPSDRAASGHRPRRLARAAAGKHQRERDRDVCGAGGYGSPAELYAEKKGLRPPLIDTGTLKRGRWGEAAVFKRSPTSGKNGTCDARKCTCATRFAHRRDPGRLRHRAGSRRLWRRANQDGQPSVFRAKWLVDPAASVAEGEARPPLAYELQTLTEELLGDCPWGVLPVVIDGEYDWDFLVCSTSPATPRPRRVFEDVDVF